MKPLLFLDVDGVLNCPSAPPGLVEQLDVPFPWSVHAPLGVAARLHRLASLTELWWATSWFDDANVVLSPLFGLPELPVLNWRKDNFKLTAIVRTAGTRPWVWLDDDTAWEQRELSQLVVPESALALQVPERRGLDDAVLAQVEQFCRHR